MDANLQNKIKLISKIYSGDNNKNYSEERTFTLLIAISDFIKEYPNVFNVKNDIKGILEILKTNLNNLYNNKDILTDYFELNNKTTFNKSFNLYLDKLSSANIISDGLVDNIDSYETAINRINIFLECINE